MRGMFSRYTFSYDPQKLKNKALLSLEKKKLLRARFLVELVMLPAQSMTLANSFACMPACMMSV